MKNYPLEIEAYNENYGYWSKGHHDKQAFIDEVKKCNDGSFSWGQLSMYGLGTDPHYHTKEKNMAMRGTMRTQRKANGGFPVTRVQL